MSEAIAEPLSGESSAAGTEDAGKAERPAPKHAALRGKDWQNTLADAHKFIKQLKDLRENDKGKIAALRRSVGQTSGEARNVAWLQFYLHGKQRRPHDEKYFLVATLFDLNRHASPDCDLGETLRHVAQNSSDSFERRFLVLLDAQFDRQYDALDGSKAGGGELAYRLGQMVKLAASKNIGICWPILLADLCCWEWDRKPVQKKWARNFYAPQFETDSESAADEPRTPSAATA